ncbi:hypothetical protein SDC9_208722 [bioreactor metagenome]|uniref:Uncharacterized protein n=1 Tax=bioreactor metagenome TaxID=1076179 RepID=A0A645JBC5_9ZZZZ
MPPKTAAMNALNPGKTPMNGWICGYLSAHIMPAAAARAEPIANVRAIILSTLTPIRRVVSMSFDMALIASLGGVL